VAELIAAEIDRAQGERRVTRARVRSKLAVGEAGSTWPGKE